MADWALVACLICFSLQIQKPGIRERERERERERDRDRDRDRDRETETDRSGKKKKVGAAFITTTVSEGPVQRADGDETGSRVTTGPPV